MPVLFPGSRPFFFAAALCLAALLPACSRDKGKPGDSAAFVQKAKEYIQAGNDKAAIIELRNAVSRDPKNSEARYQLGLLYLRSGEPQNAFQELQRAASLDPSNIDAKIKTAEFNLLGKNKEESRRLLAEVLAQEPANVDGLALLANLELLDKNATKALQAVDQALAAAPEQDRLHSIRGRVLTALNRVDEAVLSLRRAIELAPDKLANHQMLYAFFQSSRQQEQAEETLRRMLTDFPDRPEPLVEMAMIDMKHGRFDAAEKNLQQAVGKASSDKNLRMVLANFYRQLNRFDAAERTYLEGLSAGEDDGLRASLADLYFEQQRFDEARKAMDAVLARNGKHGGARLVQAKFLVHERKGKDALPILDGLIHDYSRWGEPYYTKSLAHMESGEEELARRAILDAIQATPNNPRFHLLLAVQLMGERNFDEARKEAAIALRLNPRNHMAALLLAKSVLFAKDYETAEKMLQEIAAKLPDNIEVLGSLGLARFGRGKDTEAAEAFTQLLRQRPGNRVAWESLLKIEGKKGKKVPELIRWLEGEIAKIPDQAVPHILLAGLQLAAGAPDAALAACDKAQQLDANLPEVYGLRAMILQRQGKTDAAITEYRALIAHDARALGGRMVLGQLLEQRGEAQEARKVYQELLSLKPDFAPAANNLAWLIAEETQPDLGEALRLAMLARKAQPNDPNIADTLGWVHYKRNSYTLARSEFEQAVALRPEAPIFSYHLAMALADGGKKDEALKLLDKLLAGKAEFKERAEAEKLRARLAEGGK
ncbi:MAG: hypothetical protein BWK76_02790 [Desulfobulbaceae bacterium A2]|nr:MAG: hypothetical protein BWK76_02790 [Desulfobulbaceae bacterium A2]